jgi:hypothetical protein
MNNIAIRRGRFLSGLFSFSGLQAIVEGVVKVSRELPRQYSTGSIASNSQFPCSQRH